MADITLQNPLDVIKALLDSSNNQQIDNLNSQDKTQQTQNAYQKGVNKALSEHGYNHGSQALAMGVDPNEIANHDAMQAQDQSTQQAQSQTNSNPLDAQIADKQKQIQLNTLNQLVEASKAPNFLQRFSQNIAKTNGGMTQADYLANLATTQKLAAGQPAEIALPQAQANYSGQLSQEVQQKIAGQVPLQPADLANIRGGLNTLSLDSLKASSDKIEKDIEQARQIADLHQKTINLMGHAGAWFSGSGQAVAKGAQDSLDYINKLQTAKAKVDAKISSFNPMNPLTGNPINNNSPSDPYAEITRDMAIKELSRRK